MLEAILKELDLRKDYLPGKNISTLYFGGGTPSLLGVNELEQIIRSVQQQYSLDPNAEITLEANPDDLTKEMLSGLKRIGINRLSIGVQSFADIDLRFMNRAHQSSQVFACLEAAKQIGFKDISIDLIYGIQTLTDEQWERNLELVFDSGVNHLSCYALTIEPRTAFSKMISDRKIPDVDEEKAIRHFNKLCELAAAAGFEQYEISNFARNKNYSRHNNAYWKGESYLGLGPSAHSFDGKSRQWNVRNNPQYIRSIQNNLIPCEMEVLTLEQKFNEYILTQLRTCWGIELNEVERNFGKARFDLTSEKLLVMEKEGWIKISDQHATLTQQGKLLADKLAADLFW